MPLTVPVLRVLEACRGERTEGPLVLPPLSGKPIDRRDGYRMVARTAKAAGIPRHISPHSLRHAATTNALGAGVTAARRPDPRPARGPRTTEHYDRARGHLDRHGVHFLTAYVAGVWTRTCRDRSPARTGQADCSGRIASSLSPKWSFSTSRS